MKRSFIIAVLCLNMCGCIDQDALEAGLEQGMRASAQNPLLNNPYTGTNPYQGALLSPPVNDPVYNEPKYFPELDFSEFWKDGGSPNLDAFYYEKNCGGKTLAFKARQRCEDASVKADRIK